MDESVVNKLGRSKWFLIFAVIGVAALISALVFGYIPATDNWNIRKAKQTVASAMIDPTSAKFPNVFVSRGPADLAEHRSVCGAINAKNAFAAYVGETRFIFDPATEVATLDPKLSATEAEYDQAIEEYRDIESGGFAYQSTLQSIKDRAVAIAIDIAKQKGFEDAYTLSCSRI